MEYETVIEASNLYKMYTLYSNRAEKWADLLLPGQWGIRFEALQFLDFQVKSGEAAGFVGLNGSGKTTLCNLIAGVSRPSSGRLEIKGKAAMIAVGAGMQLQLTGLENIKLKCLLMGISRRKIRELTPKIIEFADIGSFIDQPVKTYSSGMRSRLAFAISINIDPDILVIDEGLSVGDATFVNRCLERIQRFRDEGKTMIFSSHATGQVERFCERLIWLEGGRIRADGTVSEVSKEYGDFLKHFNEMSQQEQKLYIMDTERRRLRRSGKSGA